MSSQAQAPNAVTDENHHEEDASGTYPVALRPSYRPVAREAEQLDEVQPEDPEISSTRTTLTEMLEVIHREAKRLEKWFR